MNHKSNNDFPINTSYFAQRTIKNPLLKEHARIPSAVRDTQSKTIAHRALPSAAFHYLSSIPSLFIWIAVTCGTRTFFRQKTSEALGRTYATADRIVVTISWSFCWREAAYRCYVRWSPAETKRAALCRRRRGGVGCPGPYAGGVYGSRCVFKRGGVVE